MSQVAPIFGPLQKKTCHKFSFLSRIFKPNLVTAVPLTAILLEFHTNDRQKGAISKK